MTEVRDQRLAIKTGGARFVVTFREWRDLPDPVDRNPGAGSPRYRPPTADFRSPTSNFGSPLFQRGPEGIMKHLQIRNRARCKDLGRSCNSTQEILQELDLSNQLTYFLTFYSTLL